MAQRFAVLDDDTFDGMVIGWATNVDDAAKVYNRHGVGGNLTPADFRFRREPVTADPDINTRHDAKCVEHYGAWAPVN